MASVPAYREGGRSFEEVFEKYRAPIYRFCLLQSRNVALAEDLASEVMFAAYQAYDPARFESDDHLRNWLFRIAHNEVAGYHRREKRRNAILRLSGRFREQVADAEDDAIQNTAFAELMAVMRGMSKSDRRILSLRAGAGLSNIELAEVLGITPNGARLAVARAAKRFAQLRREAE